MSLDGCFKISPFSRNDSTLHFVAHQDNNEVQGGIQDSSEDIFSMELDDLLDVKVVVTASKTSQTIEQAPSIIDVITADEIRQRGYATVGEALRSITGVSIIDDHLNQNIGIRGIFSDPNTANEILKLMINGQTVAFRPNSQNVMGPELIPIDIVKQIEVIRGPGSALYGANAFLGVINIITLKPEDFSDQNISHHQATLNGFYLQNETANRMNGSASIFSMGQAEDFSFTVAAVYRYADRSGLRLPGVEDIVLEQLHNENFELYDEPNGFPSPGFDPSTRVKYQIDPVSKNDLERVGSAYTFLQYNLGDYGSINLDGSFQYFDRFAEFQEYSLLTHKNRIQFYNSYVRLFYELAEDEGLSLRASVAFSFGEPLSGEKLVDNLTPSITKLRDYGYKAIDLTLEGKYAFAENNQLTLGVDYSIDMENLIDLTARNEMTNLGTTGRDFGDETFSNLGVYVQWFFHPITNLGITLGTRMDYSSVTGCDEGAWNCFGSQDDKIITFGNSSDTQTVTGRGLMQLSNRFAAVYELPSWNVYTKIIYGNSFKPPSPYQLYHDPVSISWSTQGDPGLKPQTADSYELLIGYKSDFGLHVTLDYYFTLVKNMVVLLKESSLIRNRNADATSTGVELNAQYAKTFFTGYFNFSYLLYGKLSPKKRSAESDSAWEFSSLNVTTRLGRYPDFLINLGLNFSFPESHLNLNVEAHIIGNSPASIHNNQLYNALNLNDSYELDPYVIFNITVSTIGLKFINEKETVFSLSFKGVPGGYVQPGTGGIDIPASGVQAHFSLSQQF
jgi:outer membrane receptor for ferrienterochelin and colicins